MNYAGLQEATWMLMTLPSAIEESTLLYSQRVYRDTAMSSAVVFKWKQVFGLQWSGGIGQCLQVLFLRGKQHCLIYMSQHGYNIVFSSWSLQMQCYLQLMSPWKGNNRNLHPDTEQYNRCLNGSQRSPTDNTVWSCNTLIIKQRQSVGTLWGLYGDVHWWCGSMGGGAIMGWLLMTCPPTDDCLPNDATNTRDAACRHSHASFFVAEVSNLASPPAGPISMLILHPSHIHQRYAWRVITNALQDLKTGAIEPRLVSLLYGDTKLIRRASFVL